MPVTLKQVTDHYPAWQVQDMAGGWVAVRKTLVSRTSGLSNVRCGETLDELAANLRAETKPREGEAGRLIEDSLK